jgi:hypothetical protein
MVRVSEKIRRFLEDFEEACKKRNWGWRVSNRIWDEVEKYFREKRYELGI